MPADLAGVREVLKDFYGPMVEDAKNNADPTRSAITNVITAEDFEGDAYVWPIRYGRNTSYRAISESETLPTAGRQKRVRAKQEPFLTAGTIEVTKRAIDRAKSNRGAFVRTVEEETEGLEGDARMQMGRMFYNKPTVQTATPTVARTGSLGRVNAISGTTLTIGEDSATTATEGQMRWFEQDYAIVGIDPTDGSFSVAMVVEEVDQEAGTIEVDTATGLSVGDHLYMGESSTQNAYDQEWPSLDLLINTAAGDTLSGTDHVLVHNVSSDPGAGGVDKWAAVGNDPAEPVGDRILNKSWRQIMTKGDGMKNGTADLVLIAWEQIDQWADQLRQQRRYDGETTLFQGVWEGVKITHGTLVGVNYIPTNDFYRLNPSRMAWLQASPPGWDTEDGGNVLLRRIDKLHYAARYISDEGLVCKNRNSHFRGKLEALA